MPTFEPRDPNFEARCRDELARQGLMGLIGAVVVRIEPGFCELHLPYRQELTQQHGYYHAGMVSTLADNAGGYAAASLMPADTEVLAVEFKIKGAKGAGGTATLPVTLRTPPCIFRPRRNNGIARSARIRRSL